MTNFYRYDHYLHNIGLVLVVSRFGQADLNGAAVTPICFLQWLFPAMAKYLLMIGLVLFAFTTILGY